MVTVAGATAFKAICGSSPATAATFSLVAIPEMDRYGYNKKLSTGIVACVGTLGVILPPSVTLIIFGIITDQFIGRLFLAGIVPGLIISFFFVVVIYAWCKINSAAGPKGGKTPWAARIRSLPELVWVGIIFILMIGGILKGFFTPTEAGSVGTLLVLILVFIQRDMNFRGYIRSVKGVLENGGYGPQERPVALPQDYFLLAIFIVVSVITGMPPGRVWSQSCAGSTMFRVRSCPESWGKNAYLEMLRHDHPVTLWHMPIHDSGPGFSHIL